MSRKATAGRPGVPGAFSGPSKGARWLHNSSGICHIVGTAVLVNIASLPYSWEVYPIKIALSGFRTDSKGFSCKNPATSFGKGPIENSNGSVVSGYRTRTVVSLLNWLHGSWWRGTVINPGSIGLGSRAFNRCYGRSGRDSLVPDRWESDAAYCLAGVECLRGLVMSKCIAQC